MSKSTDKLKNQIKDKMLYLAMLAGLAGGGKAAATPTFEGPDKTNQTTTVTPQLHSSDSKDIYYEKYYSGEGYVTQTHSADEELEPALYFAPEELGRAMARANLDEKQREVFAKAYLNSINKEGKITPSDLRIVMERARLSLEQMEDMSNSLLPEREKKQQNAEQSKGEAQQNAEQSSGKDIQWHEVNTKHFQGRYAFVVDGDANHCLFDGSFFSINPYRLMPKVYRLENGKYKCGPIIGDNFDAVYNAEARKLTRIMQDDQIRADLDRRENGNETLNRAEKWFMKKHTESLEKHGLKIGDNGELVKISEGEKTAQKSPSAFKLVNRNRGR